MPTRKAHARWEGTLTSDTMISLLPRWRSFDYEAVRRLDGAAYESLALWNFSRDFLADITEALMVRQVSDVGWSDWGMPTNGSAANRQELEERVP